MPIPLSQQSFKERGFNQAEIIASFISALFGFPVLNCLCKVRDNSKQAMLKGLKSRQENVFGVYKVIKSYLPILHNIILVDDVYTTGATMAENRRLLEQSGAGLVWGLSLFRGG